MRTKPERGALDITRKRPRGKRGKGQHHRGDNQDLRQLFTEKQLQVLHRDADRHHAQDGAIII